MCWSGKREDGVKPEGGVSMKNLHGMNTVGLALLAATVMLGLSGCDYWPPALQAQIEQAKAETDAVKAEKAAMEKQVAALTAEKTALAGKIDEMTRLLKTRADQVASLEQSLAAEREKVAKMTAPKAKAAAKAPAKKTAAKTTKKK
jgi:septal ring factor EnvC (AmiA/AmiB activator)